jgi:mono/diheme cytochrome c family protein
VNRKAILLGFAALGLAGCHTDMWRQPKIEPYSASSGELFTDGGTARPLLPGTIARDHLREDATFFTGVEDGKWTSNLPAGVTAGTTLKAVLLRGQDRFKAYCTPCHGQLGDGEGMIARRGFELKRPVGNYHTDRLRKMPIGHFYDVITNGYGAMYSYASRIEPQDRWAIAAYIRVLQLSQNAEAGDVDQAAFEKQKQEAEALAKKNEHKAEGEHE